MEKIEETYKGVRFEVIHLEGQYQFHILQNDFRSGWYDNFDDLIRGVQDLIDIYLDTEF